MKESNTAWNTFHLLHGAQLMKKLKEILPLIVLSLFVSQKTNAESAAVNAATTVAPEKMKATEAAKSAINQKIKSPGSASGAFVEENGPSFVEWSAKQKGMDKIKDKVSDPAANIDVKKAAEKLQKPQ